MGKSLMLVPARGVMKVKISVKEGENLVVGRKLDSHLGKEADNFVSDRHFELSYRNSVATIRDLESRNGTFVNGVKVGKTLLKDGDNINVGMSVFVVRFSFE